MDIFYSPKQVPSSHSMEKNYSKSPLKAKLVVEKLLSGECSSKMYGT